MNGRSFESYVQFIFSSLLNMKDEGVVVGRDVQLVDKFGLVHQVDIYYQFEREFSLRSRRVRRVDGRVLRRRHRAHEERPKLGS